MILLFYCFDYIVGPKEANWWAKWTMNVCCWEEWWRGGAWAQRTSILCKPYSSHAKPKEAMSWLASRDFLLIYAVRWQFKSRVDPSRASKPWSSRVSFRFSQGNKDSKIFPLRYIRKTSYLEQGEEEKSRTERTELREETQRRIKAEIIKRLGDWFFKYQFNSSCFIFSLLFIDFILAISG